MSTPEAKARDLIDQQLTAAGWVIQDRAEMDRRASLGVAVREYPFASGPADYLLLVDGKACGIVEAKKEGFTLSGVADQAVGYGAGAPPTLATWGTPLRFDYEASGSEILFSDRVDPDQRSRPLFSFHKPDTLHAWLKDGSSIRARLFELPPLDPAGLRECQIEAIEGIEHSLRSGQARSLVQMATGAGKTFTAATLCYRLLAHAGAHRVLFLVDRNNLGKQTLKEFQTYRPPGTGRLFTELHNVQRLGPTGLDKANQVVISTIQRVFAQLTGADISEEDEEQSEFEHAHAPTRTVAYSPALPPETFDFIIVDECHRSIYGSWRQVLDYFDAQIIGLTATPSPATLGFFNRNLVAEYPYERSVADGVNVPFEIYRIRTQIGEHGGRVPAGYSVPRRDKHTRRQRYEQLDDDLVYAGSDLDRSVVVPNQIRTVLETYRDTLSSELFPGRTDVPKTLIFAKDDHHAEEIVGIAKEVFGKGNDFAKKITYAATEPERILGQFRTEYLPRIAVTVDMIATGTDVKPIEVLIFLRDVRSAIYFEQMRGRGVRSLNSVDLKRVTPDAVAKDRFVLIDAVGVTESDKTITQPLERKRTVSFEKLLEHVASGASDEDTVSSLAHRLSALDRKLSPDDRQRVADASQGRSLSELAGSLVDALDQDRIERADDPAQEAQRLRETALMPFDKPLLRNLLVELKRASEVVIDNLSSDIVISSAFDPAAAERLTTSFRTFIQEQGDDITALQILLGRPAHQARLTYQSLEELRTAMMRPPWLLQPLELWSAYRRLQGDKVRGNPAKALTDIVALVRFATGSTDTLAPLSSDIAGRFNLWIGREKQAGRTYNQAQLGWLEAIRDHLAANIELPLRDLQELPQFERRGGIIAARAIFPGRLDAVVDELTMALVA
ncbi:type I restriction enzyme, R subunit [Sphingomonas palmae]|uniref:Type I restriction enzyme, R subunit n=1 Tax=Sphingomonas palmae TaxID=1855283 RepID=A0A1H7UGL5_9SPHN|nr:DEAD/DEAH box helicase family protein [Sphingomonas palmae]SEL95798.1 type I restriction enzyme, R subunit [Sphingomonas palmae]